MEDLVVACPLVPDVPHLVSGSCSSPRTFVPRFLQTPPHGDALTLRLSFGSTSTWTGDSHPRALRHARHTRQAHLPGPPGELGTPRNLHAGRVRCCCLFGVINHRGHAGASPRWVSPIPCKRPSPSWTSKRRCCLR